LWLFRDITVVVILTITVKTNGEYKNMLNKNNNMFNKNLVSKAIIVALGSMVISMNSYAAEVTEEEATEVIVVTGMLSSIREATRIKRDSSGVVDAIAAEDIGKFPDTNLAESLQRITGVSIDRSGGEGQQVSVRGMGPSFNSVLLNGRQMPNSGQGRAFNFNDIAAEMVRGVEVYKTPSAAMQSGGIGATINIKTAKPLDIGDKMAGTLKFASDVDAGSVTPQASALFSTVINDNFGILAAGSYSKRDSVEDQVRVTKWLVDPEVPNIDQSANTKDHYFVPQQAAYAQREDTRTRINGNLGFQYAPTDNFIASVDLQYSDFEIARKAEEVATWFSPNGAQSMVTDTTGTVIEYDQGMSAVDFFTSRPVWRTVNQSAALNLDWDISDYSNLVFEHSEATAKFNPDGEYGGDQTDVQIDTQWGFKVAGDLAFPTFNTDDYSTDAAAKLRTWVNEIYANSNTDDISQTRLDYSYDADDSVSLSAGVMYTDQTKDITFSDNSDDGGATWSDFAWGSYGSRDVADEDYTWNSLPSDFMSDYSGSEAFAAQNPGIFSFDPILTRAHWLADVNEDANYFAPAERASSYNINEETIAAYVEVTNESDIAGKPLTVVAGVRYEHTSIDSTGNEGTLISLTYVDGTENMGKTFDDVTSYSEQADYSVLLPNLAIKLEATDDVVVRFAASRTLSRPSLASMTSVRSIDTTRPGGLLFGKAGNPGLKPYLSDNVDLSTEWYINDFDYISATLFVKNVSNFVVDGVMNETINGVTDPSTLPNPVAGDTGGDIADFQITRPVNGDDAQIHGYELAAQHAFGESGFGAMANATFVFTDTEFDIDNVTQTFAITGLSHSANLIGYFEKNGFQARIAYNWRDEFLQRFGQTSQVTTEPTIVDAYGQIDISASYDITENMSVFVEGINITDEGARSHGRYATQLVEATRAGARYALGIRASF